MPVTLRYDPEPPELEFERRRRPIRRSSRVKVSDAVSGVARARSRSAPQGQASGERSRSSSRGPTRGADRRRRSAARPVPAARARVRPRTQRERRRTCERRSADDAQSARPDRLDSADRVRATAVVRERGEEPPRGSCRHSPRECCSARRRRSPATRRSCRQRCCGGGRPGARRSAVRRRATRRRGPDRRRGSVPLHGCWEDESHVALCLPRLRRDPAEQGQLSLTVPAATRTAGRSHATAERSDGHVLGSGDDTADAARREARRDAGPAAGPLGDVPDDPQRRRRPMVGPLSLPAHRGVQHYRFRARLPAEGELPVVRRCTHVGGVRVRGP